MKFYANQLENCSHMSVTTWVEKHLLLGKHTCQDNYIKDIFFKDHFLVPS